MNITISDLQNMTARQIAIFAAANTEIQETQTDRNEVEVKRYDTGVYSVAKNGEFIGRIENQNASGNMNSQRYELLKYENGKTVSIMVGTLPSCKKAAKSL